MSRTPHSGRDRPRGRRSSSATVRIDSIAAGGEGVGRLPDGKAIFVHRTAPGDLAEVRVTEAKPRWARGRLLRVLEPGPNRREPPCPYYTRCGGCTLEHLDYAAQLEAKGRIVADALSRIARMPIDAPAVVPSPRTERYRNRVSFALRRQGRGTVVAGFHALGAPDEIVDIGGSCLLPEAAIARVWNRLRSAWGPDAQRLPAGEQLRLTLRATEAGEVSLLVEGGFSPGRPAELLEAVEGLEAIWHRATDRRPILLAGVERLAEWWDNEIVTLAGAAFLQVNRHAARLLEEYLLARAGALRGSRVVDAYCGVGLHARRLARAGADVVGIELDADAVQAARAAAPVGAEFWLGPVETLLPAALPASLVILNPPRAGASPEVAEALLAAAPDRLLYVSCNPATLARDLRRLAPRFRLQEVRCFDLFPQTAHVETVATLTRTDDPP